MRIVCKHKSSTKEAVTTHSNKRLTTEVLLDNLCGDTICDAITSKHSVVAMARMTIILNQSQSLVSHQHRSKQFGHSPKEFSWMHSMKITQMIHHKILKHRASACKPKNVYRLYLIAFAKTLNCDAPEFYYFMISERST